ncbi:MAG: sensor histidine kinase [Salaquimonas sp.]
MDAAKDASALQPFIQFYLDASRNLSPRQVLELGEKGAFSSIETATPNFGYIKSAIWLRINLRNVTEDISEWRLFFRENFMQQFAVYKISEGGDFETLILQNELSKFQSRPISFPELVAPLSLEPRETATLLVRYESGGSSELSFSIETIESFESLTSRRTAKNFIYYGMVVLLCIIALMAYVATRQTAFVAYTFYAISALMFIVHADGNGFKYVWPDYPLFNAFATIFLGTSLSIACTNFARIFLKTPIFHPILDKALIGMMALAFIIFASSLFFDHQQIKQILILTTLLSIVLATASGFVAALTRFKEVRFYVLAWTGVLVSASIMASRHWLGIEISEELQFDSMRIVLVVDATMMGLAIWDNLNQGRKAQHLALKSSLASAERSLKLSTRLHELEQKFETVTKIAEIKDNKLINTLHDLRQPLHALRLNVNNLAHMGDEAVDQNSVEQTFNYLENLVSEHFSEANNLLGDTGDLTAIATAKSKMVMPDEEVERIDFDEILKNIHEMFLLDAEEKQLDFRFVKSSKNTDANALVIMRMINNLVANSIKYTDQGKILLGVRQFGDHMRIEIHDTGSGMSRAEFETAKQRHQRLGKDASRKPGDGHGLAIVEELADRNGYKFDMLCERSSGLSLGITVPVRQ